MLMWFTLIINTRINLFRFVLIFLNINLKETRNSWRRPYMIKNTDKRMSSVRKISHWDMKNSTRNGKFGHTAMKSINESYHLKY